jgi:hypothetical protein
MMVYLAKIFNQVVFLCILFGVTIGNGKLKAQEPEAVVTSITKKNNQKKSKNIKRKIPKKNSSKKKLKKGRSISKSAKSTLIFGLFKKGGDITSFQQESDKITNFIKKEINPRAQKSKKLAVYRGIVKFVKTTGKTGFDTDQHYSITEKLLNDALIHGDSFRMPAVIKGIKRQQIQFLKEKASPELRVKKKAKFKKRSTRKSKNKVKRSKKRTKSKKRLHSGKKSKVKTKKEIGKKKNPKQKIKKSAQKQTKKSSESKVKSKIKSKSMPISKKAKKSKVKSKKTESKEEVV